MRVAVPGYGRVSPELARTLAIDDHDVWGAHRSDDGLNTIEVIDAEAVRVDVTDADSLGTAFDVDHVVFAASSGGHGADTTRAIFVKDFRTAIDQFAARDLPLEHLICTSSTGVCDDHDDDFVDESTSLNPTTDRIRILAEAECVAREYATKREVEGMITWLAGLYGPNRYWFERYLNDPVIAGYLNMVHRDDATGIVASLLKTDRARNDTIFVVDDEPVSKHELADWLADECDVPRPEKHTEEERLDAGDLSAIARRRILTSKHCSNGYPHEPDYSFVYPTYREGYRAVADAYRANGD